MTYIFTDIGGLITIRIVASSEKEAVGRLNNTVISPLDFELELELNDEDGRS